MHGLTSRLARHIVETPFEALPAATVDAARRALLDGIGVMIAASGLSRDVPPFIDLARSSGGGEATILGTWDRVPASAAAFANGAMAHALDYEDTFDAAACHPNASLIPAALALAEADGSVSGRDLIAAVAIGGDLVCRMGLCLTRPMEDGGWYPPPILGAFGAVAAAARVMRLSPGQVADAFSLLLCQLGGPGEIKHSPDTVIRAVREAFPAQAAVTSILLARAGVRGFDAPLEGEAGFFRIYADGAYDAVTLLDGLGERFLGEDISFKPWPACRGTHGYIELALHLAGQHRLNWRDIGEIRLTGGEVQAMLALPLERKRRPATSIDAKFSLPYTVALALVDGDVTLDSFDDARLDRPDILSLTSRISYRTDPAWGRSRATAAGIEIAMANGDRWSMTQDHPLGHPSRPLDNRALIRKFTNCCAHSAKSVSDASANRIAERLYGACDLASARDLFDP